MKIEFKVKPVDFVVVDNSMTEVFGLTVRRCDCSPDEFCQVIYMSDKDNRTRLVDYVGCTAVLFDDGSVRTYSTLREANSFEELFEVTED